METKKNKSIKEKVNFSSGIFFGIIPFLFILYLLMGPLVKVLKKDFNSQKMYIISESLNIRSDKNNNSYVIGSFKYGTEVNVYKIFENQWAEVSVGKKKGFMSLEYLVDPETYFLIDGMFGNDLAQANISKTIYKKAIATYLSDNNYISNIDPEKRKELYGNTKNKEIWQIFAEKGNSKFNSFCYGDFNGDKITDAAFIIKNINTDKTKLIVLEPVANNPDKYSKLLFSMDLDNNWFFIRKANKNSKYLIDKIEQKLPIEGILIGTNRDKALEDGETLLIYNGEKFNLYKQ